MGTRQDLQIHAQIHAEIGALETMSAGSLRDVVEESLHDALDISDHPICSTIQSYKEVRDSVAVTGNPPTMLVKCYNGTKDHGFSFGRRKKATYSCVVDIEGPTNTIQCTYSRMPRLFVPLANSTRRFLRPFTITELKLIQGFPRDFLLKGTVAAQVSQIGNAVPPPLVRPFAVLLR